MRALLLVVVGLAFLATPSVAEGPAPAADDKATKDDYALDTAATSLALQNGAEGSFSLVIRPKNGKKVHPDAPLELAFKDNKGVKPGKLKLGRGDVVTKGAAEPELKTTLKALQPGTHALEGQVTFFLCTDAWCQRMQDKVTLTITVQ